MELEQLRILFFILTLTQSILFSENHPVESKTSISYNSFPVEEGGVINIRERKFYVVPHQKFPQKIVEDNINNPDSNAALKYINAYNSLKLPEEFDKEFTEKGSWDEVKDGVEIWINENHKLLEDMDEASGMEHSVWPKALDKPIEDGKPIIPIELSMPEFPIIRELAKIRLLRCRLAIENGKFSNVEKLIDLNFKLANQNCSGDFLINYLVGKSIKGMSLNLIREHLEQLPVENMNLEKLIDENAPSQSELIEALKKEKKYILDSVILMMDVNRGKHIFQEIGFSSDFTFLPPRLFKLIVPEKEMLNGIASHYDSAIELMELPYQDFQKKYIELRESVPVWNPILKYLTLNLDNLRASHITTKMKYQMTKTAVALQRYQKENGTRAKSISDLIPNYIKEWPKEGFNGTKLKYILSEKGYRVYFHGKNNEDHKGNEKKFSMLVNEEYPNPKRQNRGRGGRGSRSR